MSAGQPPPDAVGHLPPDAALQAQLLAAVTQSAAGFALVGTDGVFLMVNQALADLTGYDVAELVGRDANILTHPDDVASTEVARTALTDARQTWTRRRRYRRKDGTSVWVDLVAHPVTDDHSRVVAFTGQVFNAEESQQSFEERDRLLAAVQQSPAGYLIVDPAGTITYANTALCTMLACTPGTLISRPISDLQAADSPIDLKDLASTLMSGDTGPQPALVHLRRTDGSTLPAECYGHPVHDLTGQVVGAAAHVVDVTSQEASKLAQSQLAALLVQATYGYLVERIDGSIVDANEALATMAGVSRADLLSGEQPFARHPEDQPRIRSIMASLAQRRRTAATFHARYQRPDASVWWAEVSVSALHDRTGEVIGFVKLVRDITDELAERSRLRGVEALWAELVHNSTSGYVVGSPDGDVVDCNAAIERMLDQPRSELIGRPVLNLVAEGDRLFAREKLEAALAAPGATQLRVRLAHTSGDAFWVDLHLNPVHDGRGHLVNLGCVVLDARSEVAAQQRAALAEADLIHRSTHDSLTGVLNRAAVLDHVREALDSTEPATLLFIDIDGFKSVNDHLGHPVGDTVLRILVERVVAEVPAVAVVGRLGGDEFGVVLPGEEHSERDVEIAEAVLDRLRDPIELDGSLIQLTASIGLAAVVGSDRNTDEVLRNADLAMYAAKSAGGDRIRRFTSDLADRAVATSRLRHELAAAIRRGGFELDYQPIVDLQDASVVGAEALVRLRRGTVRVPAGTFVKLAEQTGQIVGIGRIVLDTLAVDITRLRQVMRPDWFVTVNVSAKELADPAIITRLVDGPLAACARSIYLEVTEGLELASQDATMGTLRSLRDGGYRIAIDDFGTGYSNFERLGDLRPDLFKIDRSLVVGGRTSTGTALLAAAVGVARTLNCRVLAEGVENNTDHQVVTALPIDFGQGFHYARPAPLSTLLASLGHGSALGR